MFLVVALALVVAPFLTGTAQAVSTCVWDSGTATITVTPDEDATLAVSGQDIMIDGAASCAPTGATTATVNQIDVSGPPQDAFFTIDLSQGPFAPGADVEGSGQSEIEISLQLGADDLLTIIGTSGADNFELGTAGANLNADDDVDVTLGDMERISLVGAAGGDVIAADGSAVVGGALPIGIAANGGSDNDSIAGGDGPDVLLGEDGADELFGGAGADSLSGGPGPDELTGGQSIDTATYEDAPSGVTVNLNSHNASGGWGADTLFTVEDVIGSPFADSLTGDDFANVLLGGNGNDTLNGRGGPDDLFGLSGRDRASFAGAPSKVTVNLGLQGASGWGVDFLSVEDVTGSSNSDRIIGSGAANRISAGGGNDTVRGSDGPDVLSGDAGRDRVDPGLGEDRASGGSGRDTIDLSGAPQSVTINLATGRTGGNGPDRISGFENAVGSRFADALAGNGGQNALFGGGGDDRIGGLGRADRLEGGPGQDKLNGGDGPDRLNGGAAHDVLSGGGADDRLSGGDGPDLLHGDAGNDALNGGPGTDTCFQDDGSGPKTSCEKPAPPPPSGGGGGGGTSCTAGYSPCIPPGPDVDCAGGSGNGPRYTQPGVVYHVTGSDPYGLDADNDGLGCE